MHVMGWRYAALLLTVTVGVAVSPESVPAQTAASAGGNPAVAEPVAIQILESASDQLKDVEDIQARTSLTDGIVKLLAKKRPARCRESLTSLFDDVRRLRAELVNSKDADEDKLAILDSTIQKVIVIAAGFDRKLGKAFIEKHTEDETQKEETAKDHKLRPRADAEIGLRVAAALLDKDAPAALSFAQRAIDVAVPPETLLFLASLRKKDITSADNFFAAALSTVERRRGTDVNELLVLYCYIFSPTQIPQVNAEGLVLRFVQGYSSIAENYQVNPILAKMYFNTLYRLIGESRYSPERFPKLTWRAAGDFFLATILAPTAAKYFPPLVESFQAQQYLLTNYLNAGERAQVQKQVDGWGSSKPGNSSPENKPSAIENHIQWAEKTPDIRRKTQLYLMAASAALREHDVEKALEIVEKVPDEFREKVKQFILFHIAKEALREGKSEQARERSQKESDPAVRAYLLILLAADFLEGGRRDYSSAEGLLLDAVLVARKLNERRERVAILLGAASISSQTDTGRAFELFREAIAEANKIEAFDGEPRIIRKLDIGGIGFFYDLSDDRFTLAKVVSQLGRADFNSTLLDVQGLQRTLPRLRGLVALCGTVLPAKGRNASVSRSG
ncbi:MAG TPA: hypothetical protein VEW46_08980 [Pyrinomonadaceae bacterium]|nr:hypothetical protein [Pyrinomonadaceae bacterium]